jgi:hypothetical protein
MRGAAFIAAAVIGVGTFLAVAAMFDFGAGAAGLGSLLITVVAAIAYVMTEAARSTQDVTGPSWEA